MDALPAHRAAKPKYAHEAKHLRVRATDAATNAARAVVATPDPVPTAPQRPAGDSLSQPIVLDHPAVTDDSLGWEDLACPVCLAAMWVPLT